MKIKAIGGKIFVFLFVLTFLITCIPRGLESNKRVYADEKNSEVATVFRYDPNQFQLEEDYAVYVSPGMQYKKEDVVPLDPNGNTKMRLDEGKSGILISSIDTGDAVEGKSVVIDKTLYGDFSMDFRVFSDETYQGKRTIGAVDGPIDGNGSFWGGSMYNDQWNPYMDLRTVGIKITSALDRQKSFTIYIEGGGQYNGSDTKGRVYIEGESFRGNGRKGYGLTDGVSAPKDDFSTWLHGTSFCNISGEKISYSNQIFFDVETMSVYAMSYVFFDFGGTIGNELRSEKRLLRNLATNNLKDDNSGGRVEGDGLGTLSQEDFSCGYTVEMIFEDVTADDIPLTKAVNSSANGVYNNATAENFKPAYPRTAKMVIYSINDQQLKKYEGWNKETFKDTAAVGNNTEQTGVLVKSVAKNADAEGNSFTLNTEDFLDENGEFYLAFSAATKNYAQQEGREGNYNSGGFTDYNNSGIGANNLEWDPYSDVRETAITFRSKSDPSKAFTVYVASRDTERRALSARVGVEGETYRTGSGQKGFGGDPNAWAAQHRGIRGTFGMYINTGTNAPGWGKGEKDSYAAIRFNPATMEVFGFNYGWEVIRDLSDANAVKEAVRPSIKTLEIDDFAAGFTVEFTVEKMNTEFNKGLKSVPTLNKETGEVRWVDTGYDAASDGVHLLEEGYDREANIKIISYSDGTYTQNIDQESVIFDDYAADSEYKEGASWLELDLGPKVALKKEIEFTPVVVNLLKKEAAAGTITYSSDNGDYGEIVIRDGKVKFSPTGYGKYDFRWEGYQRTIFVVDTEAPVIKLKDGLKDIVRVNESLSVSENDVSAEDPNLSEVTLEIKKNGEPIPSVSVLSETGVYEIIYTATDTFGNSASVSRAITVLEKLQEVPSVIIWKPPITVKVGEEIALHGFTAHDAYGETLSVQVQKIEFVGKDGAAKEVSVSENRIKSEVAGEFRITLKAGETEKTYRIAVTADEEQKAGFKPSIVILTLVIGLCIMAAAMVLIRKKSVKKP